MPLSHSLPRKKIEGVGTEDCCTQNRKGPPLFKNDGSLAIILEIILLVGPVEMEKQRDRYTLCETHTHTRNLEEREKERVVENCVRPS